VKKSKRISRTEDSRNRSKQTAMSRDTEKNEGAVGENKKRERKKKRKKGKGNENFGRGARLASNSADKPGREVSRGGGVEGAGS